MLASEIYACLLIQSRLSGITLCVGELGLFTAPLFRVLGGAGIGKKELEILVFCLNSYSRKPRKFLVCSLEPPFSKIPKVQAPFSHSQYLPKRWISIRSLCVKLAQTRTIHGGLKNTYLEMVPIRKEDNKKIRPEACCAISNHRLGK